MTVLSEAAPEPPGAGFYRLWEDKPKPRAVPRMPVAPAKVTAYVGKAFSDEIEDLATTPPGKINDRLNQASFSLGQIVGAGHLNYDDVWQALHEAAVIAYNGNIQGEGVPGTINSGMTAGMRQPRDIPEPVPALAEAVLPTATTTEDNREHSPLPFHTVAELRARVAARGPRRWLVRGWWPAGSYGVHGAEMKAQKTWNAVDLAVSVASGTPWLGAFPVDDQGAVLVFAGEGGEGATLRRIDAVATSRGLNADDLDINVCTRAPHLGDSVHMSLFAGALEDHAPRLVILDPLYLAAKGAKLGDLYAMGALLERPQHMCSDADAALFVVTHHNRGEGRGAHRLTGAGPAEWGRVLINGTVISRHTDPETGATRVLTELDGIGGEIADQSARVHRHIVAEDPDDLDSPLRYEVTVTAPDNAPSGGSDMPPARAKLLEALRSSDGPATGEQLVERIVEKHGHRLKRETVSRNLNALATLGLVDCLNPEAGFGEAKLWTFRTV